MCEQVLLENSAAKPERVRYWDIVKGIAIIAMILGHTVGIPSSIRALIFSFHMPIFFIANAYFIVKYDVKDTLKKAIRSLLVPYVIVCLIAAIIYTQQNSNRPFIAFGKKLKAMLGGMSKTGNVFTTFNSVWLVWFVCCLFVARILYVLLCQISRKLPQIVLFCIVVFLAFVGYQLGIRGLFLPWSVDVALFALIFMWFGHSLRKYNLIDKVYFKWIAIPAAIIWIVMTANDCWIEMATRSYHRGILCIVTAILGSIVIIELSRLLDKINLIAACLAWTGKNSMIILAVHCLEMMFFNWSDNFYMRGGDLFVWIPRFIFRTILILAISMIYVKAKNVVEWMNKEDVSHQAEY